MNSSNIGNKIKEESNQIKLKEIFEKIKSKYILKKIFNNLEKKKLLNIVKNNKNIRKKIDINIDDYKEYLGIYSLIEIQIKIANNEYGKFINIKKEEDKKYYHIYFNNNNEEIKRNYINENDNVSKIKIIIDYQVKSFYKLFQFVIV